MEIVLFKGLVFTHRQAYNGFEGSDLYERDLNGNSDLDLPGHAGRERYAPPQP